MEYRFAYRAEFALLVSAGCVVALSAAQGQTAARPEFDVASVKPTDTAGPVSYGANHGQAGGRNVTLKMLIALAYRLQEFQVSGGPGWVGSARFDVEGKTQDATADPDRLRLMLRALLEDRFQLRLRRETKVCPVYDLVAGKSGPKIKLSADQTAAVDGPAPAGSGPNHGAIRMGAGSLIGNAVTLQLFAKFLSQRLDRAIIDKTNLSGRFDIRLQWTPDAGESPLDPGGNTLPAADSSGPSVFAAIQEQLGLKLEAAKGAVEVVVIEHVERPSEN